MRGEISMYLLGLREDRQCLILKKMHEPEVG